MIVLTPLKHYPKAHMCSQNQFCKHTENAIKQYWNRCDEDENGAHLRVTKYISMLLCLLYIISRVACTCAYVSSLCTAPAPDYESIHPPLVPNPSHDQPHYTTLIRRVCYNGGSGSPLL